MPEEKKWLSTVERRRYIAKMKQWTYKSAHPETTPNGQFPLDHGTDFDNMTNDELCEWYDCYTWALDPENFKSTETKKGG